MIQVGLFKDFTPSTNYDGVIVDNCEIPYEWIIQEENRRRDRLTRLEAKHNLEVKRLKLIKFSTKK